MSTKTRYPYSLLIFLLLFGSQFVNADSLRDANRLLRVANVQQQFESATEHQTRALIRTYSSIVSMSAEINLPPQITQRIAECYAKEYAWDNFKQGLAQILADNLSSKELQLLIGFYLNLGLPPTEIKAFRELITKSSLIQQVSLEFMLANSKGCVEQDTRIILDYIDTQKTPQAASVAIQ